MNISIAGTGNVASVLGKLFISRGHQIVQVAGRNLTGTKRFVEDLGAGEPVLYGSVLLPADLWVIAISDDALAGFGNHFQTGDVPVAHTAGSVSMNVLKTVSSNYGVLYPLQSLRKEIIQIPPVPFLIEANNVICLDRIRELATSLSDQVYEYEEEKRFRLHLAAVAGSNFMNHILTLTYDYCKSEMVDFAILFPLLKETLNRINYGDPSDFQTGPATRNDQSTIDKQKAMLKHHPALLRIYEQMTESIRQYYAR